MTDRLICAALYIRVSTSRQAEADLSIPDQIKQLTTYCERKGWQVADTYVEPGASALDDDRPVFQEMVAAATSSERPYDRVVVHSLSRFSRDVFHSALYGRKLEKAGVSLISITQDVGDDANGKMIRTILNAFDEHSSRENAKHTHRNMLENARQGFWNGSRPPFGYRVETKERRGTKDKKVLVINEAEAEVVRLIADLYLGRLGKPLGLKAICNYLNERGITRRGHKWGIGSLQDLMASPTYCGRHMFNRVESRTGRIRPDSECVEVQVPAIITEDDFNNVRASMQARSPRRTPPRIVNGPTMLAGVARCTHCGAAMILNTGKGHRYYACSFHGKKGKTVCKGQRIRMDKLDGMVLEYLGDKIFAPVRLEGLLRGYMETQEASLTTRREKLRKMRQRRSDAQAARTRLLTLVETGAMDPNDPELRDRLSQLKLQQADLESEINTFEASLQAGGPMITPEKVHLLSEQMRERLRSGPPDLRQAYMRLLLKSVEVGPEEVRLSGSNAVLERLAAQGASSNAPEVISFALKWRPHGDSNPGYRRERAVS
jgi:site-specific DNA recombinase